MYLFSKHDRLSFMTYMLFLKVKANLERNKSNDGLLFLKILNDELNNIDYIFLMFYRIITKILI